MGPFMPISEVVISGGLSLFAKVSAIISGFVGLMFAMRISFLVVRISPPSEYGNLLQSVIGYFGFTAIYPVLLKLIIATSGAIASRVTFVPLEQAQLDIMNFVDALFSDFPIMMISGKISFLLVKGLAYSIFTALISLFVATAPIFIFLGTMFDIQSGLKSYFGILISLSLWPVLWNILGQLAIHVGSQFKDSPVSSVCFWGVIMVLQLLSPLFAYSLFNKMSVETGTSKVLKIIKMGKGI